MRLKKKKRTKKFFNFSKVNFISVEAPVEWHHLKNAKEMEIFFFHFFYIFYGQNDVNQIEHITIMIRGN